MQISHNSPVTCINVCMPHSMNCELTVSILLPKEIASDLLGLLAAVLLIEGTEVDHVVYGV